jgi:hypothetical protein
MDRFRIQSLEKALSSGALRQPQRRLVLTELRRKCRIYAAGCRRRGREEEAARYEAIPPKYEEEGP